MPGIIKSFVFRIVQTSAYSKGVETTMLLIYSGKHRNAHYCVGDSLGDEMFTISGIDPVVLLVIKMYKAHNLIRQTRVLST